VSHCERVRRRAGRRHEGPAQPPDPQGPALALSVEAPNSYSADLAWTSAPDGTDHFEIHRDGRLIDEIPAATRSYRDYLLWQSTEYGYELRAVDSAGDVIASEPATVTTPAQADFPRPYSDSSPWNTPIGPNPELDPDSNAIIAHSIAPFGGGANLSTTAKWGLGLAYANPSSRLHRIGCDLYGCDESVSGRIPSYATPNTGSDGKLTVVEPTSGAELDMWRGVYHSDADRWSASWRGVTDVGGWGFMCTPGEHCNGPNAAGNTGLSGVVRPEEIAQGHIDHALQMSGMAGYTRYNFIACPATHWDGRSTHPYSIPEGARVQLDPAFDVGAQPWPEWKKVVARALQQYGAIIDDSGGSLGIAAENITNRGYDAWQRAGVGPTTQYSRRLSVLPWDRMRVLKITEC
jgi:hypothetical protein